MERETGGTLVFDNLGGLFFSMRMVKVRLRRWDSPQSGADLGKPGVWPREFGASFFSDNIVYIYIYIK